MIFGILALVFLILLILSMLNEDSFFVILCAGGFGLFFFLFIGTVLEASF